MQCRAARTLLDWSQPLLALRARLGLSTIVDFELSRRSVSEEATLAIREALEDSAVVFINDANLIGVGLRIGPQFETHQETIEAMKDQSKAQEARAEARNRRKG